MVLKQQHYRSWWWIRDAYPVWQAQYSFPADIIPSAFSCANLIETTHCLRHSLIWLWVCLWYPRKRYGAVFMNAVHTEEEIAHILQSCKVLTQGWRTEILSAKDLALVTIQPSRVWCSCLVSQICLAPGTHQLSRRNGLLDAPYVNSSNLEDHLWFGLHVSSQHLQVN